MAYDTLNPVPSTDPRDLYDNAAITDKYVNGDQPFVPDRLGKQRRTWKGMEEDFNNDQEARATQFDQFLEASAFVWLGDYGAGITFTSRSQYLVRDGYAYRLADSTTLPYTTTGNWAIEQAKFSLVNTDDVLRQDLASTAENAGAKLVGGAKRALSADQFGCIEGADISAAFQAACDEADARGLLLTMQGIGNAVVTGDLVLPQYFDGAACVFTGNHKFIHRRRKHARAHSFTCTNMLSSGVWNCSLENINVTNRWTIDGCEANWGTFWNTFANIRCGQIYVNVKYQAVNNNSFKECLGNAVGTYGLLITDEGATSSAGIMEAHNNTFEGCDFSQSGGARNEIIVRNQVNMLFGCYFEHGAQIIGNWNAIGCNIDGSSPPVVTSRNYVIGQADHSDATMGDSFPTSIANLCVGGDWSAIDSTGKPPSFSASFSATAQGTVTPTNWGFTGRYGGTVTGAFQYLDIKFTTSTGKFSSVIFMEFPDGTLPVGIEISDGTTTSYRTPSECSNEGNGRYLYRISGSTVKNAECTIRFLLTGSTSATRTAFIGAAFISAQKSALFPMFVEPKVSETSFIPGREFKKGVFSKSYTSGASYFDVSVTYGSQFRSSYIGTPVLSFLPGSAFRGNYSKYELLTATSSGFTARVYYVGDWSGDIFWQA